MAEGTCKCGLDCPFQIQDKFDFDPQVPSLYVIDRALFIIYSIHSKNYFLEIPNDNLILICYALFTVQCFGE